MTVPVNLEVPKIPDLEKKGDEGAGAGALSLVGVRAAPGRPRVADTGAAFHMPSTASGRPGGFAALAGDGRHVGYAPGVAAPGRDADEGTGAATDGGGSGGGGASPLDPRDAFALRADLVAANPLAPRGLRPAAARAPQRAVDAGGLATRERTPRTPHARTGRRADA